MKKIISRTDLSLISISILAIFLAVGAAPLSADDSASYNFLIWNRANHEARNNKVDRGDWFEWWYYKVVVPQSNDSFYFVYGVVNPWDTGPHARAASNSTVAIGSFGDHEIVSTKFSNSAFHASYESTQIDIENNHATDTQLIGTLAPDVNWNVTLEKDWAFNAMGWAISKAWLFNIYWYPAQASATMSGKIHFRGRDITLDHAPAYQDRNWGRSLPAWWTWLVSNRFDHAPGTILAAGGGRPRVIGTSILEGVTIGLRHQGHEYTFRPTSGDWVSVDIRFGHWYVWATNRHQETIEITADAPREKFMDLPFTSPRGEIFHDLEALRGHLHVVLSKNSQVIADLNTDEGGIEYGAPDAHALETVFGNEGVSYRSF